MEQENKWTYLKKMLQKKDLQKFNDYMAKATRLVDQKQNFFS